MIPVCDAAAKLPDSGELLREAGIERGIVVRLGCRDVGASGDLHADGRYVVQTLDRDLDKVVAARKRIEAAGCYGPVSARVLGGEKLPFADNLINLLVVDDPPGVSEEEMFRVVRPLGIVMTRQGDEWKQAVKPWPDGMDEWTHFLHDATGNAVSQDRRVGPPRRLQWSADHLWGRSHELNNSFPALVTARGRMFYVFDYGVTGMEDPRLGEKWTLIARDAFNGTLLWQWPLPSWGSGAWGTRALRFFGGNMARRLVADGDLLFVTFDYGGPVAILAAATGKTLGEIPGTEGAEEILVAGDQVVVVGRRVGGNKSGAAITGYDVPGKKVVWRADARDFVPQLTTVGTEEVVYHNRQEVVCLDRDDGSVRWRFDDRPEGKRGGPTMLLLAGGKVVVASRQRIITLSMDKGQTVWTAPSPSGGSMREYDVFFAQGAIWCAGGGAAVVGYGIRDGKPIERVDASSVQSQGHHLRCYRAKATEDWLITQFRGIEFVSLGGEPHCQNDWLRGTCTYGVMPANGLLYVPPHSCFCYAAAMYKGFNAFAAEEKGRGDGGPAEDAIGPIEKGPAYGWTAQPEEPSGTTWPSYRHDARRTGASSNEIPGELRRRWKVSLGAELTPPVASDGRVFVAAKDRHKILCLHATTGETLWTFAADARIDSPPSIDSGLMVFGGADGFLYCVRVSDGQLAWRRRLAPHERWMAVEGQLESVWRLHGSVLIQGDLIYCTAGRSTFLDGGLRFYAVDVNTGEVKYRTTVNTATNTREDRVGEEFMESYHIEGGHSDVLVAEGGFIYLNQMRFSYDLKPRPAKYLTKEEVTARPSINLDNKEYVNEDIFNVPWRGERMSTYDKLADILVDEKYGVGERDMGRHLFTTSGFLDTTFFNRTYWMYSPTWPGFNHSNLAPKSGQLVVIGPKNTYALKAYTSRYPLSPKLDPQTKGYLLVADDNENDPTLDPRAWAKDKGMGFSRGAEPVWHRWLPVRVRAMTLGGNTLVTCGPPDVVKQGDPMAAFEGRLGSELWAFSAADGTVLDQQKLDEVPIFDGMIVAGNRVYLCTEQGAVICMGSK